MSAKMLTLTPSFQPDEAKLSATKIFKNTLLRITFLDQAHAGLFAHRSGNLVKMERDKIARVWIFNCTEFLRENEGVTTILPPFIFTRFYDRRKSCSFPQNIIPFQFHEIFSSTKKQRHCSSGPKKSEI